MSFHSVDNRFGYKIFNKNDLKDEMFLKKKLFII